MRPYADTQQGVPVEQVAVRQPACRAMPCLSLDGGRPRAPRRVPAPPSVVTRFRVSQSADDAVEALVETLALEMEGRAVSVLRPACRRYIARVSTSWPLRRRSSSSRSPSCSSTKAATSSGRLSAPQEPRHTQGDRVDDDVPGVLREVEGGLGLGQAVADAGQDAGPGADRDFHLRRHGTSRRSSSTAARAAGRDRCAQGAGRSTDRWSRGRSG